MIENIAEWPIRDLLRLHQVTDDAEVLAEIEIVIADRSDEVADAIAAIVEQAAENRIIADGYREWARKKIEHAKTLEVRADKLHQLAIQMMHTCGQTKMQAGAHTVSIRATPPKLEVFAAELIPPEFMREKYITEPDKQAIKEAIKNGLLISGVELTQGERLEIK